jgi:thiol:disulfide interchange protein DsbD
MRRAFSLRRLTLFVAIILTVALSGRAQDPFSEEFKAPPRDLPKELPPPKTDRVKINPAQPDAAAAARRETIYKTLAELIDFKAKIEPVKAKRGQVVRVTVEGVSKPFAYTYSAIKTDGPSRTRVKFAGADGLTPRGKIQESPPELKQSQTESHWILHDRFWLKQEFLIAQDATPGKRTIEVQVLLQVCTKKGFDPKYGEECLLPGQEYRPLRIELEVEGGDPVTPPPEVAATPDPSTTDGINFNDLGGLLLAAFGGALLMLLTPCVFPMIPITVNFFIKQSEKEHHRPFFMASVYAGSIILLLTVVMLTAGNAVIQLALNPWFNLGLGGVLILFALGLFGLFEVDLGKFGGMVLFVLVGFGISVLVKRVLGPNPLGGEFRLAVVSLIAAVPVLLLLNRIVHQVMTTLGFEGWTLVGFLSQQESRGGAVGAAFMAMTFTVTSFSCTGPFLGIMLAPIANANPPIRNLMLAALVYSVTFAAPFFLLALFPSWLKKLPKSGGWMTTIKVTMGFLEIAAALKFLSNTDLAWFPGDPRLFNYDTVLCAWIALSVACSLYLFGIFKLDHDEPETQIGPIRMVFASLFFGMAIYLTPLLFGITPKGVIMEGAVSFLPVNLDMNRGQAGGPAESVPWIHDDYPKAWEIAKRENKLIFIDFTGQNCQNCRENERNVFPKREVIDELKKYVCVKLYTDFVPDSKLTPDESKAEAGKQLEFQIGLDQGFAQPVYTIIEPDREQPFNGTKLKAKLIDSRKGKIFDVADFTRFLQKPAKENRNEARAQVPWLLDFAAAQRQALRENKPIFVNFTALNDVNSRQNEREILDRPEVVAQLKKDYVCAMLHLDTIPDSALSPKESATLANRNFDQLANLGLGFVTTPSYVVLEPDPRKPFDGDRPNVRVVGHFRGKIAGPEQFLGFLKEPTKNAERLAQVGRP